MRKKKQNQTKPITNNTMSETTTKGAAKPAKKKAVSKDAESVQMKCTVLEAGAGRPIAGMICAAGKVLKLSEAKAQAAEKQGWVKINGLV